MAQGTLFSVTEAMNRVRATLETVRLSVIGEVSEVSDKAGYKAAYFTVCDAGAAMPCLMWKDDYSASGIKLECGMLVEMNGNFSAYVPKGRMQFVVRRLALAGEGTLRMQVAELARRLEAEGLFAPARKRPVPRMPARIAVVTSPRGKAVHDVLRTLKRRYPLAEVLVAGVPVEGVGAPGEIARGLAVAGASGADVVLLVRGGGSYEDLMPFNSEVVARAIVDCPVPVISGVGHEPDTTISDMAADLRASTPTAAAEAAATAVDELESALSKERRLLGRALAHRLERAAGRVERLAARPVFCDAHALLALREQRTDLLSGRLRSALPGRLASMDARVDSVRARMVQVGGRLTSGQASRVALAEARLTDLSPLAILERGYAVAYDADGAVIRDPSAMAEGSAFRVRVEKGTIAGTVTGVTKEDS